MILTPYLVFDGNTEIVMKTYANAFNGTTTIKYFKDMPQSEGYQIPNGYENRVLHGVVEFKNEKLFFSDNSDSAPKLIFGNNITIAITFESESELVHAFETLKEGSQIFMPLGEVFFARLYVGFTDKFGVSWQFIFGEKAI